MSPAQPQTNTPATHPLESLLLITQENASEQKPIVLLKGPSGTGKTHNVLSYPEPILLAYTDKNMATVNRAQALGKKVTLAKIETWSDWADVFVPAVENRRLDAATIALDTVDMLTKIMWREIQGGREKLRIQDFGTGLDRMVETLSQFVSAAVHYEGKPSYNIVATSHTSDVTDDGGSLVKTTCAVMGALKDNIEDVFDYVLLSDSETKTDIVGGKAQKSKRFFCHTIPPTRYHTTKAPGFFPSEIGNTWADLQDALALESKLGTVGEAGTEENNDKE